MSGEKVTRSIRETAYQPTMHVTEARHAFLRSQITSLYPDVAKEALWSEVQRLRLAHKGLDR